MWEFILAVVIVLFAGFLLDRWHESEEKKYTSHKMEYEELHKYGVVQYFLIDHNIHSRYRIFKYTTMLSMKLNIARRTDGIYIVINDRTYHVQLDLAWRGSEQYWVLVGDLTEVSPPPLPDNIDRTRIPKHTWNKAP